VKHDGLKLSRTGLKMNPDADSTCSSNYQSSREEFLRNRLSINYNAATAFGRCSGFPPLGTDSDNTRKSKVSTAKNKKNAPAGELTSRRPKRRKEKLIRLDDLIPKQNVVGGRRLLFGATDPTQPTNNPRKEN
jgi:hypothetical protein